VRIIRAGPTELTWGRRIQGLIKRPGVKPDANIVDELQSEIAEALDGPTSEVIADELGDLSVPHEN
jgi:hypothetical protein